MHLRSNNTMTSTIADGSAEDEETKARDQRKAKRKSTLASKKLEKDGLDPKSKKTRVLVEVI